MAVMRAKWWRQEDASRKILGSNPGASKGFFPYEISTKVSLNDHLALDLVHYLNVSSIMYHLSHTNKSQKYPNSNRWLKKGGQKFDKNQMQARVWRQSLMLQDLGLKSWCRDLRSCHSPQLAHRYTRRFPRPCRSVGSRTTPWSPCATRTRWASRSASTTRVPSSYFEAGCPRILTGTFLPRVHLFVFNLKSKWGE